MLAVFFLMRAPNGEATGSVGNFFRGIALFSPVLDEAVLSDSAWNQLPVFIAHGVEDERVPDYYVTQNAARLKAASAQLDDHRYPGEDHFVFSAKRRESLNALGDWIEANR